jgi:permuted papain-like amidase YaeF/Yiix C92 family enzyme
MGVRWWLGRCLVRYLARPRPHLSLAPATGLQRLADTVQVGDVLLVEGTSRFSSAVKYLTQSTWSHAALVVDTGPSPQHCRLIEADLEQGVREVPLDHYRGFHTRLCRSVGLTAEDLARVVSYARERVGYRYDLRNIIDLARYLIQTPPAPSRWRRRMLALGSGDPTRAICSTLIAQAFQSVRYPILPEVEWENQCDPAQRGYCREILHIRHYSLFAPRDFDISPYFQVIKPSLRGFDPYRVSWSPESAAMSGISQGATGGLYRHERLGRSAPL